MVRRQSSGFTSPSTRTGFTLIEILVVVAIIGILIALLLPAVQNVRIRAQQTQTFSQISEIAAAIGEAKSKLKVDQIPPGPFTLKNAYNGTEPECNYLLQMWPNLNLNGTGLIPGGTPSSSVVLDSNQTLLFFLTGGTVTNFTGFSTSPTQPFSPVGENRIGPFLKLPVQNYSTAPGNAARTMILAKTICNYQNANGSLSVTTTVGSQSPAHAWLLDPYGSPYAYFASIRGKNGMYYAPLTLNTLTFNTSIIQSYELVYTNGDTCIVSPYISNGTFINATGFQLISAGRDSLFSPGGTVIPPDSDDQANFSKTVLGGGIN